jgi:hypothetical protein
MADGDWGWKKRADADVKLPADNDDNDSGVAIKKAWPYYNRYAYKPRRTPKADKVEAPVALASRSSYAYRWAVSRIFWRCCTK